VIGAADVERLVLTPTYWHLMPLGNFEHGRHTVLDAEIARIRADLETERQEVAWQLDSMQRYGARPVAVIDTNVVLQHHSDFTAPEWHKLIGAWPHENVRVLIPILVIDELDRLKRSQGTMTVGREQLQRQTVARQALRTLAALFHSPGVE
jgi:hypothetical protein